MYEMLSKLIENISNFMYSYLLIIMLLAVGLYFTFRTKFVQFKFLGESIRLVTEKKGDKNSVSPFEALMVSTASRVGTGNIVGVANAIAIGGYGAVFWMWVIALVGGASAFVESTLAQIFKKRDKDGGSYGGPAYYIEAAMGGKRWLGVIFAIALIATYAVGFNMLCSYNLISSLSGYAFYGDPETSVVPMICGAVLAVLVGICVLGGGKRIVKVTGVMVPVMGISYIVIALIFMVLNLDMIPGVLKNIFASAFDFKAIFGGFAGSALMQGIKRGLYSNEAGVGSAPNASASAEVSHPVKQGLVQVLSVFIDTILVCSATAFMCMCSGVEPTEELSGAPYVQAALSKTLGGFGPVFITIAMILFAFTTLLGNLYYVDKCIIHIMKRVPGKLFMTVYHIIASLIVFAGSCLSADLLWNLADVLMGGMTLINMPVIFILSKYAVRALKDYEKQRYEGKTPVFRASDIDLPHKVDCWE